MPAAPPAQAAASGAPASPGQSSAPSSADPVVVSVQTKRVATGHTLWALSKSYYGDPTHYPVIYEANRAQIHNPNVIYPGQVFVVPKSDAKP
jgi:nucleoid-associated protein YgaU